MTPLVRRFYGLVKDAHLSHWFDIGELTELPGSRPGDKRIEIDAESLVFLPFPNLIVVGTDKKRPFAIHALTSSTTQNHGRPVVAVAGFALAPTFIELPILSYGCSTSGDLQFWRKDGKGFDDVAQGMIATLQHLTQSLSQGPRTAYLPTPVQSFTNKRKIAQGKTPTITWNTITIQPTTPKTHTHNTTHASPKAHTRRGHWRNLKTGKKIWVKHCSVGDPSKGIALHDYRIKSQGDQHA